jgi:hypothetical protein
MGKALSFYRKMTKEFMLDNGYKYEYDNDNGYNFEDYFSKEGNPLEISVQFEAEFDAYNDAMEEAADKIDVVLKSSTGVSVLLDDVASYGEHTQGMLLYDENKKKTATTKKEFLAYLGKDLKRIEKYHKEFLAPKLLKDAIVALHVQGAEEWKKEYYWFIQNSEATWQMVKEAGMEDDMIKAVSTFGIEELLPPEAKDLFLF